MRRRLEAAILVALAVGILVGLNLFDRALDEALRLPGVRGA